MANTKGPSPQNAPARRERALIMATQQPAAQSATTVTFGESRRFRKTHGPYEQRAVIYRAASGRERSFRSSVRSFCRAWKTRAFRFRNCADPVWCCVEIDLVVEVE